MHGRDCSDGRQNLILLLLVRTSTVWSFPTGPMVHLSLQFLFSQICSDTPPLLHSLKSALLSFLCQIAGRARNPVK